MPDNSADPDDERWMRRALALARRAQGRTSPNPLVGAVLVKAGREIAHGHHAGPGSLHAETLALERAKQAGVSVRGATLYVTLEPCCHTDKRTPPCAPRVVAAGLARVVVAMQDVNPKVAGGGLRQIAAAGVSVSIGCLEAHARALNAPYIRAFGQGLPWVTLKFAQTLDGKVATASGQSQWITGEVARRHGHRMRGQHDVILIGVGTLLADDPQLTCRVPRGRNPMRVVVDSRLRTPPTARVLTQESPGPTILATVEGGDTGRRQTLESAGAHVVEFPAAPDPQGGQQSQRPSLRVDLTELLRYLARAGHHRVLCEGGPELAASLLAAGLVDRVAAFVAPMLMGSDASRGAVGGPPLAALADCARLGPLHTRRLGDDLLITADVVR
ncbi:MAG: bifunctional diaminohydroxyphosphoribosylaminopyrimidine deaminase/5-amino-6-(5-phosphoribosylamino)uracil reductase RibD [Nitrospirota bacterium]|nr:bifunctional diaminohydroxyphosphoribosylaminopyrimidine deaminase/5-amino-6-(5-phosphoribosylamino)uracil reductase RibD [Nitrospirota bacterium]